MGRCVEGAECLTTISWAPRSSVRSGEGIIGTQEGRSSVPPPTLCLTSPKRRQPCPPSIEIQPESPKPASMAWDDDEVEVPDAPTISVAELAHFDDAVSCLLDEACAGWHELLRALAAEGTLAPQDRGHAVACLLEPECATKYTALVTRMRQQPCEPSSACPGGRGCNLKNPVLTPPGCTSLVLGRLTRGLLANPRNAALYVGEARRCRLGIQQPAPKARQRLCPLPWVDECPAIPRQVTGGKLSGLGSMRSRDGTQFVGTLAAGAISGPGRHRFVDGRRAAPAP